MRRHRVESSAVRSVGYDEERHELEIEYADGGVYRYSLVPRRRYEELLAAPSIGAYVAEQVRPNYPVTEVDWPASVPVVEIQLGEVRTWYDVHGDGEPLVYLHGGFNDSRSLDDVLPTYAMRYRVYRYDRRGHGRTPDVGPLTYELMAQDAIAFLETVVGGPARLVGFSDGAVVALLVAVRRPELVKRLVCISGQFSPDGLVPGIFDEMLDPDAMVGTPLEEQYGEVSPDGIEHFREIVAKVNATAQAEPQLSEADLARVTAPTLVMSADDDLVTLEHTVALYRGVPDSQLAVVPGTSHVLVVEKADLVNSLVLDFLGSGPPQTILPVRRA